MGTYVGSPKVGYVKVVSAENPLRGSFWGKAAGRANRRFPQLLIEGRVDHCVADIQECLPRPSSHDHSSTNSEKKNTTSYGTCCKHWTEPGSAGQPVAVNKREYGIPGLSYCQAYGAFLLTIRLIK